MADIDQNETPGGRNETPTGASETEPILTRPARRSWRERLNSPALWFGVFLVGIILFTRLFNLGLKPVQHDESMFAYYAYLITDKYEQMPPVGKFNVWGKTMQYLDALPGYEYMPIMHGPVLEWGVSFIFWIFGDSDYTMRLLSALCSIGILGLLFLARRQIGVRPALWGIFLLAICPSFLYVSRSIRPDLPMLFTYILIIFAGLKYRQKPTGLRMMGIVILMWFSSCVHETYVIFFFLLGTFLFGCWLHGMVKRKAWNELAFGLVGLLILAAAAAYGMTDQPKIEAPKVSGGMPDPVDMKWSRFAPLAFLSILGMGALWFHSHIFKPDYSKIPFYNELRRAIYPHYWALIVGCLIGAWLSVTLMTMNYGKYERLDENKNKIGHIAHLKKSYDNYAKTLPDGKKPDLIPFLESYLNQNFKHWNGQYEAVVYWKGQHEEDRISGPFHFHWIHMLYYELPMTLLWAVALIATAWPTVVGPRRRMWRTVYLVILAALVAALFLPAWWTPDKTDHVWSFKFSKETAKKIHMTLGLHIWLFFVPLILVMMAGWRRLTQGKYFHAFADYWTVGSFLAYGYAGEKVPWLEAHIALPMMISLGFYISDFFDRAIMDMRPAPARENTTRGALEVAEKATQESRSDVVALPLPVPPTSASSTKRPPGGTSSNKKKKTATASTHGYVKDPTPAKNSPAKASAPAKPGVKTEVNPKVKSMQNAPAPARPAIPSAPLLGGGALGGLLQDNPLRRMRRADAAVVIYLGLGILFTVYVMYVSCFKQPGSPVERHSYACSHTQYHQAITFLMNKIKNDPAVIKAVEENRQKIADEGKRKPRVEYPTVIALEGTHEWPAHWQLRRFTRKTFPKVPLDTTAEYIILDNTVMAAKPAYKDRYEWSPAIRFRHYWVPRPLRTQDMFKIGLLLASEKSLKPEEAKLRKDIVNDWKRLWYALVLRDEEALRNGGWLEWREMSGYDVFFGRKLSDPLPAVQPPAPIAPPAPAN